MIHISIATFDDVLRMSGMYAYYYIVYTNFIKPYDTRKIYIDHATYVELRAHNKNAIALDTVSRDTDALRRNGICCTVLRALQHYSKHCSTTASIAALQQALHSVSRY